MNQEDGSDDDFPVFKKYIKQQTSEKSTRSKSEYEISIIADVPSTEIKKQSKKCDIRTDFYVFRPKVGYVLKGEIISIIHISALNDKSIIEFISF